MKTKKYGNHSFIDMTGGSVTLSLVKFACPLAAGSVFQLLYSTTDLLFVGNYIGTSASAAVGASSLLVTCLIGIFTGIAAGTGITVSQGIGAKKEKEVYSLVHTAIAFAVIAGIVLMVIGELSAPYFLRLMKTPEEITADAVSYIRIYFISLLPMILYNIGSGILRACGDSRSPFYILAAGGILNVAADGLMIVVLKLGVSGAAAATSISQTFSAAAVIWLLLKGNEKVRLRPASIRICKSCLIRILKLGLPAGIQSMAITLSNLIVQYFINGFGTDTITAYTCYFKLENFTYMPVLAFGQAVMTFTAQNMGAGKTERIKKGVLVSAVISVATVGTVAGVLLSMGTTALGWFGNDTAVVQIGLKIIAVSFPLYWLNSLIEVFGGAIRGMGYSFLSMIIVIGVICGGRVLLLNTAVTRFHTVEMLTGVYPITWGITALALFFGMLRVWRREQINSGRAS